MSEITRSPLCWPNWFPRADASDRIHGRFGKKRRQGWGIESITLSQATQRVLSELSSFTRNGHPWRCNPDNVIISTDLELRLDGFPRSGQKKPLDPGVAVYFTLDGVQRCIPCDVYLRIEDNLAAVAATIEALRTIERHGSQMLEAAFSGFDALPSPDSLGEKTWRDVLDYFGNVYELAEKAYQVARKKAHPDHGGTTERFNEVQAAWQQAKQELNK